VHRAALLEERAGSLAVAIELSERAAALCPDDAAVNFDRGRMLAARGCAGRALPYLTRASWLAPADERARRTRDAVSAELDDRYAAVDRRIEALGRQAGTATTDDDRRLRAWAELRAEIERRRPSDGDDASSLLRLAEIERIGAELGAAGARDRALTAVGDALDRRGPWAEALVLLGTLQLTDEPSRPDDAERAFLAALQAAPERPLSAWTGLLFTYMSTGRWAASLAAADACLALDPGDDTIGRLRERALAALRSTHTAAQ